MSGLAGLDWTTVQIPFGAGLDQKTDPRASNPPSLDIALDIQFDSLGAVETRHPLAGIGLNILGGGTISSMRRIVQNGSELLCFTIDTLYSWSTTESAWVSKGTHLASTISEHPRFVTADDQHDCDRAELNGVVVYAWAVGSPYSGSIYLAALDKTTGVVLVPPSQMTLCSLPRLVALQTKILLFYDDNFGGLDNLVAASLGPSTIVADIAAIAVPEAGRVGPVNVVANYGIYYDVCQVAGSDVAACVAVRGVTTSYSSVLVTSALSLTSVTQTHASQFAMGVASSPDGAHLSVFFTTGNELLCDTLNATTLALINIETNLGAVTTNQVLNIACAYRDVKVAGQWRCYAFYMQNTAPIQALTNWVDDSGATGTQANWIPFMYMGSRAFDYNGRVYMWSLFVEPNTIGASLNTSIQNTYFLYRDDGFLVAKASCATADVGLTRGRLSNVQSVDGKSFQFAGILRREIDVGSGSRFNAERTIDEISVSFDDNQARRCVRLGSTLYIAGGEGLWQYDGVGITEVGFHLDPWDWAPVMLGSGGSLSAGTYAGKATGRYQNAANDIERSTTTNVYTLVAVGSDKLSITDLSNLPVTHKTGVALEVWRTLVNPIESAPFYLTTSKTPTTTSNPNRYLANVPTSAFAPTFTDVLSDAALAQLENSPENGLALPNIAPPPSKILTATEDRIFLAGLAGLPDTVWYSQTREPGEVVKFNDGLTILIPAAGGNITALAILNGTLVVFRQYAIYAMPGSGDDNTGQGNGYGPAQIVSLDVGALNAEGVCWTQAGLMFKSSKGWYLLSPSGWQLQYIGSGVVNYDAEIPLATTLVTVQHEIRCLSAQRMIVYDYLVGQWSERTISDGLDACVWNGTYTYLSSTNGPSTEQSTYSGVTYGLDVETSWIKLNELQGYGRVRWIDVLGEFRSACGLRVRVAYNYAQDGSGNWLYTDDNNWTTTPTVVGGPLQLSFGLTQQQSQAIKIRLTAIAGDGTTNHPAGEAMRLSGLALEVGVKRGVNRRLPAVQKL